MKFILSTAYREVLLGWGEGGEREWGEGKIGGEVKWGEGEEGAEGEKGEEGQENKRI